MGKAANEIRLAVNKLINEKKISHTEHLKIYFLKLDDKSDEIADNLGVSIDLAKKLNNLIDLFILDEISFSEYIRRREELIPNNLQETLKKTIQETLKKTNKTGIADIFYLNIKSKSARNWIHIMYFFVGMLFVVALDPFESEVPIIDNEGTNVYLVTIGAIIICYVMALIGDRLEDD
jgi:hypothetical protein